MSSPTSGTAPVAVTATLANQGNSAFNSFTLTPPAGAQYTLSGPLTVRVGGTGTVRLSGLLIGDSLAGYGTLDNGQEITWWGRRTKAFTPKPDTTKPEEVDTALFPVTYPDMAYGRVAIPPQPRAVAITHARVWTAAAAVTGPSLAIPTSSCTPPAWRIARKRKNWYSF